MRRASARLRQSAVICRFATCGQLTLAVRTNLEPYALSASVRGLIISKMNPELPVRFTTMADVKSEALAIRNSARLVGCFALPAATLDRHIRRGLVVVGSMREVLIGLVQGLVRTLALSGLLTKLLFNVKPHDPLTIAVAVTALGAAASHFAPHAWTR